MSLNKLVGGDCGGNNTLVQLSSIVGRDASFGHPSQADSFVNEFLAQNTQQPHTFNMNALLGSVREIDKGQREMAHAHSSHMPAPYMPLLKPADTILPVAAYQHFYRPPTMFHASYQPPTNVQIQYMSDSELTTRQSDVDQLRMKAQQVMDTAGDEEYTQFIDFMKNISAGGIDFSAPTQRDETKKLSQEEMLHEMEEKFGQEWAKLSDVSADWRDQFAYGVPKEYAFTEGNVMLENKNALEIGKEKLKMGDIPGAVLCFEAAVKQQPESAEAWFLLGTTQTENEQDPLAIAALRKSLELDPKTTEAYMTLAAAYANENLGKLAMLSLYDWLKASPQYSDLIPSDINPYEMDSKQLETHVKTLLIQAAQLNPGVDPDVQNALGVLFNITLEYDKAVDCFRTALMVKADDSKLWNRLGATLANSERSEEAVNAYHEALNLEPGFVRARYNVGITCMNLGAYRQAAEHFLIALNQQDKARGMHPEANSADNSSSTIWSTLRMVCAFMGEHAVTNLVDERNLTELNKFFDV